MQKNKIQRKSSVINIIIIAITIGLLQSCGVLDLRTKTLKKEGITNTNTKIGKQILENAWKKQGYDKLTSHTVYSYQANDVWKGLFGKMAQIWPDMKTELKFKYKLGTFDGQVQFLDGKQKNDIVGLQNWNYYEIQNNKLLFKDKNNRKNKRKVFGIAAFQYFNEMIDRIKNAPIISYAGENEFRGEHYELVFCTWEKPEPHQKHDQYVAWINKKTGLMDFVQYTLRESYIKPPGYKLLGGAVEFTNFKNIDGILIPHTQLVYAIKLRKNPKRNLHKVSISNFEFDQFNVEELRPNKEISIGGDFKN